MAADDIGEPLLGVRARGTPGHRVGAVDPEVLNVDAGDHTRGSPERGHAFVGVAGPPCRPLPGDVVGEQGGPEAVETRRPSRRRRHLASRAVTSYRPRPLQTDA